MTGVNKWENYQEINQHPYKLWKRHKMSNREKDREAFIENRKVLTNMKSMWIKFAFLSFGAKGLYSFVSL